MSTPKTTKIILLATTAIFMVCSFIGLFSGNNAPNSEGISSSVICIALPAFLIGDLILLVIWLAMKNLAAIIPFITLCLSWGYIGTILQFSFSSPDEKEANLTIASYNVKRFDRESNLTNASEVLRTMKRNNVDIICLQEYMEERGNNGETNAVERLFETDYPYIATGRNDMYIFSRLPITEFDKFDFGETNNSAMWAEIKSKKGKTIRIYNVHMQSTGINSVLKDMANGNDGNFSGAIGIGLQARANQAITVANDIRQNLEKHTFVCGDFNDTPYSFTYNTLLSDLKDGFKTCGNGFAHTYRGMKGLLRIDYIFHSENIKGIKYYTEKDHNFSDHDPVFLKTRIE